jgi:hypothetical protein
MGIFLLLRGNSPKIYEDFFEQTILKTTLNAP